MSTGIPAIAPTTVSVIAPDAIPAAVRAHRWRRIRPIAAITPTMAAPTEEADDVTRTNRMGPTADDSVRTPTMNHAQPSMMTAPLTSTGPPHDGVSAGVRDDWPSVA